MDFQNPIMYYSSIENRQKLDSLEMIRQSFLKNSLQLYNDLAFNDLLQYETIKQAFFVLVDKAHSYMQTITDSRTSCGAFYDYITTTVQLKSLKTYISTISEITITKSPEVWIECFTATKKATREAQQKEKIRTLQELISIHKKKPQQKQLAARVE